MSAETSFCVGLLTVPALVAAALILWLLFSAASWAWDRLHVALLYKTDLRPNVPTIRLRDTPAPPARPKYEDAANQIRDALLRSPRLYSMQGLGWWLVLVRDHKTKEAAK